MSDAGLLLLLVPLLPLAGSALTLFAGPKVLKGQSHWPCIISTVAAFVVSVFVLLQVNRQDQVLQTYYTWFQAGSVDIGFSLQADGLTAIMLVTVTFIGSLIAIYSVGYMHDDPGYPRYFAEVALFLFSMTLLVLSNNFVLLYAGWEGVGLCSYLLIGFWFTKPSAAAAARKAFLVTRIGDVGFFLGILVMYATFHETPLKLLHSLDYQTVFEHVNQQGEGLLTVVCLLLFCGAVGKSAQFPLHVWLPDAMEGPSPVSALIHAATMVTAGVYLVARCTPLFVAAPMAQMVVAVIGAFTALLAALIALTQTDLKRVMAYSTISQLGYMFLGLGSGVRGAAAFAVAGAIFHLFTHAFFKALLFLASGSVMHAMGNVIDMRRFGGLRHVLKTTHLVFLCGAAALAGVPFLSGFWSKDEILAAAHGAQNENPIYLGLFWIGLITAGLTAFYTFRAYFMTFWGEEKIPHEAGHHAHESPPVMLVPMMVLAVCAVGIGIVVEPFTHWFSGFLVGKTPMLGAMPEHHFDLMIPILGSAAALVGIPLAWWMYVKKPGSAQALAWRFQGLYQLSLNKFHFDELYDSLIVRPVEGFAEFCRIIDAYVVDGIIDLVGQLPRFVGYLFRPIQNGLVQFYALAMTLGVTLFLAALLWRSAW